MKLPIGHWKVDTTHGIARILDDRNHEIADGLAPYHARTLVSQHNQAIDRGIAHALNPGYVEEVPESTGGGTR